MQTVISASRQKLLNLIPLDIDENDLENIQDILVKYFAAKAMDRIDLFWDSKGFSSDGDMLQYLNEK